MTTSSHPWVEEDLKKGLREANRRWRVAAVVAGHHQECLASLGPEVIDAFESVLAALSGKTDPATLRIAAHPQVVAQVQAVIDSTSGEADEPVLAEYPTPAPGTPTICWNRDEE